jgi:glycosyltransferase involved in cell wall biosynthesis
MTHAAPVMLSAFSTFEVGGPQVRFARLAALFGDSWRHAIVAMDGVYDCARRLPDGLAVSYPEVRVVKGDLLGNVRRFRAALRALKPELLVTYNWGAIEWCLANLVPLARHVHIEDGFGPEERDRQLPRRVWTRRLALRRSTVVLPSLTLKRIAEEVWRLPAERLRYVPNGIALERFRLRSRASLGPEPVIGTVAGLRPEKNLARLLGAFARLRAERPARLEIVGDGAERAALEALASRLGLGASVTFHGAQADPAPFLERFDLFALSSDTEQMPLSVLEAMASGLAVVATDVGDVRAILSDENRSLVVAKDETALAEALARGLADDVLRVAAGEANRLKAEREYDERLMADRYARIFAGEG